MTISTINTEFESRFKTSLKKLKNISHIFIKRIKLQVYKTILRGCFFKWRYFIKKGTRVNCLREFTLVFYCKTQQNMI